MAINKSITFNSLQNNSMVSVTALSITDITKEKLFQAIRSQYNANMLYSKRTDNYSLIMAYCQKHKVEEKAIIFEALTNADTDKVVKFYSAYKNWKNRVTNPKKYEQKKVANKVKAWENACQVVSDNPADFVQFLSDDKVIEFNRIISSRMNGIRKSRKG